MLFKEALAIGPGITAITGSGGKTSLLHLLADELPGRVLLCTTTHMFPSDTYKTLWNPTAEQIRQDWARVLCIGAPADHGKLGPCTSLTLADLLQLAPYVLVEADGSRRLPLKAHAAWEPAIPPEAQQTICVVGASGLGKPVEEVVHRPELWVPEDTAPTSVAEMLVREGRWDKVFINQCETPEALEQAREIARGLPPGTAFAGSIRQHMICPLP